MSTKDFSFETKQGNSDFLKIAPDTTVKIRLMSETYHRLQVTKDNELVDSREWSVEEWGKAHADDSFRMRDRFIWVVWNYDEEVAQILEVGASIYNQLKNLVLDESWGDPREYSVKITRTGEKLETKYSVVPLPDKEPVTADMDNAGLELDVKQIVKGSQTLVDYMESRE